MAIDIIATPNTSPAVAANQLWALAASDGDRLVALRKTSGTVDRLATFDTATPWAWVEHTIPVALSVDHMIVSGDTILTTHVSDGYIVRYSTDAGGSWSGPVFPVGVGDISSLLLVGSTVISLWGGSSITTADLSDLAAWSSIPNDLPSVLWEVGSLSFFGGVYYAAGSVFNGVTYEARVFRSADLAAWSVVYSDVDPMDSPGALTTSYGLVIARNNDTVLTSSDGTSWVLTAATWNGTLGRGVVTDSDIAVYRDGAGLLASTDGVSWESLPPGFSTSGKLLMFDGDVIAGQELAGSDTMGGYSLSTAPAPLSGGWWRNLSNSTQELS